MTTEDDFQAALDRCPEDWQTRLVFADWLEEQGDPRAEGYRALGELLLAPSKLGEKSDGDWPVRWAWWNSERYGIINPLRSPEKSWHVNHSFLPPEWITLIPDYKRGYRDEWYREQATRREAEDAAALAFSKLPAERRAELLATQPVRGSDGLNW